PLDTSQRSLQHQGGGESEIPCEVPRSSLVVGPMCDRSPAAGAQKHAGVARSVFEANGPAISNLYCTLTALDPAQRHYAISLVGTSRWPDRRFGRALKLC